MGLLSKCYNNCYETSRSITVPFGFFVAKPHFSWPKAPDRLGRSAATRHQGRQLLRQLLSLRGRGVAGDQRLEEGVPEEPPAMAVGFSRGTSWEVVIFDGNLWGMEEAKNYQVEVETKQIWHLDKRPDL